jgi:predicted protein tyrosine phosphatase
MATDYSKDFNFITDRLAIGSLASRSTPGFVAVVSVVTVEGRHRGRPWSAELTAKAPQVPGGVDVDWLLAKNCWSAVKPVEDMSQVVPVLIIDIADGESASDNTSYSCPHEDDRDFDAFLTQATEFIASEILNGCVLVHCGAGISRSAAVVIAYLCRFAGMSYSEALAFVKAKRPQVAPADVFKEAIERWLGLDKLATRGPRQ